MRRSYRFRLHPTDGQIKCLEKTFNLCRLLYNCALEERISYYKKFNTSLSYPKQAKHLKNIKDIFPEFKTVHSQVLQASLKRLDSGYQAFFLRIKSGERKAGFPRFKGRDRFRSILYPQSGFALSKRKGHKNNKYCKLKLSKIGNIKMRMHRNISGTIKTCQVVRTTSGKWYVCFSCNDVPKEHHPKTGKDIGIDLGVKNLVAMSNGNKIANPKHWRKTKEKLASAQRRLSKLSRRDSRRSAAKLRVARVYEKTINQRKDHYHKLTKNLVKRFDKIVLENLDIKNMVSDNWRMMNREIHQAAWGELVSILHYKAESADKEVVLVDPRNTSKMCSGCGSIVNKDLSIRIHRCDECELEIDRDHNAAINILNRGLRSKPRESRNGFSELSRSLPL